MNNLGRIMLASICVLSITSMAALAGYTEVKSRELKDGEIAVTKPGNLDQAGKTYVLMNDISSPLSALFIAKDVTLDLNGHTITYAAGYNQMPNSSFVKGLDGWDVSKAPGAKVTDMGMVHPMVGKFACTLPEGQELISQYITLPVANRSYYAMVAIAEEGMKIDINVDDEQGNPVKCVYKSADQVSECCPLLNQESRMGGGTVFALIYGQPAGKYRIRVKAVKKNCILGAVDILPAMDVGVGIVESVIPSAYYKALYDGDDTAFFDYGKPNGGGPIDGIPVVKGDGAVTIRNGVIKSGSTGILSWGIRSTAGKVKTVVQNVKFQAAGINANAIKSPWVDMEDCRMEIDTPWIINRHSQEYVATISGLMPSEIAGCEFVGGQGNVFINGGGSLIHDNVFRNDERTVNHYCLGGHNSKVFRNKFLPKNGSGFYIGGQGSDVYENEFVISSSPPVNEYSQSDYSSNAIRISDYDRPAGSPEGSYNNKVHHNKFRITGLEFPDADPKYEPRANAFFISVGGGTNYIYDNEIVLEHKAPQSKASVAAAFYIGGSSNGGVYYNNKVTSNISPLWFGNPYGFAKNVLMYDNTFIKAPEAGDFPTARLGWWKNPTSNIRIYSTKTEGMTFSIAIEDTAKLSQAEVGWTLTVETAPGADVSAADKAGKEVLNVKADDKGKAILRLAQYKIEGEKRIDCPNYTIKAGGKTQAVEMTKDLQITLK